MKKLSLNREQLKLIAICSMVIDHIAWGFLDFYTPLAQFLHVLGRLCIPIMCFFVVEGFKKSSNVRNYGRRMATFMFASMIPFYIFFHEEYGYRQNIIFDYLLGLLLLIVLENKNLKKSQKVLFSTALFITSAVIGGWVFGPMLFMLAFYYGRDFKEKAKWFCIANIAIVATLVVGILINSAHPYMKYDWVWWDKFYLLGFMLALPLLKVYNGEKGKQIGGRYFFYLFYPLHFLVLSGIKEIFVNNASAHDIYVLAHIITLVLAVSLLCMTYKSRPSKGQESISMFMIGASIYVLGFVLEVLSSTPEAYWIDCIVQYVGEYFAMLASLFFVSHMCRITVPRFVYAFHSVIAILLLYSIVTTRETGFFYSYIGVNTDGPFARLELVHSTGFYLSIAYLALICIEDIAMCVSVLLHGTEADKRRSRFIIYSALLAWIPYCATVTGLTGGYEIPAAGFIIVGLFLYLTFIKFGALDSISLAGENALEHGREGIIVIDNAYRIKYHNKMVHKVVGDFPHDQDIHRWPIINEVISGERTSIEIHDRIYDFEVEPLVENGYEQGKMIWIIDNTEHHAAMKEIEEYANRDPLTGLFNRMHFKELVDEDVKDGRRGTFIMMDMDNFKQVNDLYGHQRGDAILKSLAEILSRYPIEEMYSCRIGGDEFCAYLRNDIDEAKVKEVVDNIMNSFSKNFRSDENAKCSLSLGAVINNQEGVLLNCSEMYSIADDKLYEAKGAGKNTFKIQ